MKIVTINQLIAWANTFGLLNGADPLKNRGL